jgi:hypothetical protein
MQNISRQEIDGRFDQLCGGLKDANRDWLHYSEAVYVVNTLYRTFGINMGTNVLNAIKKIADESKNNRVTKTHLRTIVNDDKEGLVKDNIVINHPIQFEEPIKREEKVAEPVYQPEKPSNCMPLDLNTSQIYRQQSGTELRSHPNFSGSRKSLTFRTTINTFNSTTNYEPRSVTDNSTVRVVRTSNYGKTYTNGDSYTRVYVQENPVPTQDYNVVEETKIKRVQLPTTTYNNTNANTVYVNRVITQSNGQLYNSEVINNDVNKVEEKETVQLNQGEYNGNQEYSSQLKGFTIRYGDYTTKENPYVNKTTVGNVVYQSENVVRRVY